MDSAARQIFSHPTSSRAWASRPQQSGAETAIGPSGTGRMTCPLGHVLCEWLPVYAGHARRLRANSRIVVAAWIQVEHDRTVVAEVGVIGLGVGRSGAKRLTMMAGAMME